MRPTSVLVQSRTKMMVDGGNTQQGSESAPTLRRRRGSLRIKNLLPSLDRVRRPAAELVDAPPRNPSDPCRSLEEHPQGFAFEMRVGDLTIFSSSAFVRIGCMTRDPSHGYSGSLQEVRLGADTRD